MYVYKLYSNGHSYDTSLVWISLFRELILAQHVPAIILPRNFPNIRTFNLIREYVEPEIYSSDITFLDNFFGDGVESYYDHKTVRTASLCATVRVGGEFVSSHRCSLFRNELNQAIFCFPVRMLDFYNSQNYPMVLLACCSFLSQSPAFLAQIFHRDKISAEDYVIRQRGWRQPRLENKLSRRSSGRRTFTPR